MGSCILKYVDERFTLFVVGWRGTSSLRAYVHKDETIHILRLLGADLSKFETNKYEEARVAAAAAALTATEADKEAGESSASNEGAAAAESESVSPEAPGTPMETDAES